jgi:membrane-anchored protein YejM (alkaline phosphatase superfamily)
MFLINKYLQYIVVFVKTLFDLVLIINLLVFKNYKFHIDSLFIDMAINDLNGIGISFFGYLIVVLIFLFLFLINLYIFKNVSKSSNFFYSRFIGLMFILILINQLMHIWAYYFKQDYITQYTPYFPYYFPVTSNGKMNKLTKKYSFIQAKYKHINTEINTKLGNQNKFLKYPKIKIIIDKNKNVTKPNVLMIVLESWQYKMLQNEIMPNIYNFSKKSISYKNHFSTGNVTVTGLFGLFYGIYATQNYKIASSNPLKYRSVLVKTLESLNYDINAYTTSNLYRFALKDMFFGRKKINIVKNGDVVKNDAKVIDMAIKDIESDNRPWFKFIFLTSSHYSYKYPQKFNKFKPVATNMEAFLINKNIDSEPYLNKYKNSLFYSDYLIGKLLSSVDLNNTIIIITADHAEEFNENKAGIWGHGSDFTIFQTKVPLIIYFPGCKHKLIKKRTSHIDIVPTILKYLGIKNKTQDFSNGVNLLDDFPRKRDFIFASYKNRAYLINDTIISIGLFTKQYNIYNINQADVKIDIKRIQALRKEENIFLK